jgi:hypothetical protein
MPIGFLSDAERARFTDFPQEIPHEDVIAYFTLSAADRAVVPRKTTTSNRLGFALLLGTLRYLGFCPDLRRRLGRWSTTSLASLAYRARATTSTAGAGIRGSITTSES